MITVHRFDDKVTLVTTLASEGEKYDIKINAISSSAPSLVTTGTTPPEGQKLLLPGYVSPFAAFHVHDSRRDSGPSNEAKGDCFDRMRLKCNKGIFLAPSREHTPEDPIEHWGEIEDFEDGESPSTLAARIAPAVANLQEQ